MLLCFDVNIKAQESVGKGKDIMPEVVPDTPVANDSMAVAINEDALRLPTLTEYGTMPSYIWPLMYSGGWLHDWNLHNGLNVSLGASVFSTFGSGNTWSGAGFSQNVSVMYAMPLNSRWSLAVGGYFANASWAHDSYRQAGLSGILTYQFNDKWSAFLYGQKSIVQNQGIPYPLMDMNDLGDRLGIGVKYQVTPSFSVQMSVEEHFDNNNRISLPSNPAARTPSSNLWKEKSAVPMTTDNSKGNY